MIDLEQTQAMQLRKLNTDDFKKLGEKLKEYDRGEAEKAAQEFEAIFVRQMLSAMTETLEDDSMLGTGPGSDWYQEMFLQEVAMNIAEKGELGLSRQILGQLDIRQDVPVQSLRDLSENDFIHTTALESKSSKAAQIEESSARLEEAPAPLGKTLSQRLEQFNPIIVDMAEQFGVDENLVKAVIAQESYGNPNAESHAGAKGLMQLMDKTAEGLGVTDSFDPEQNIRGGVRYLKMMLDRYDDVDLALAAYNAGPGNVDKYNGIPPFKETQHYVRRVMDYYKSMQ